MSSPETVRHEELRICLHHVGARNGSREFPVLNIFEKDMVNVLYDADPDCLPAVEATNQHLESELHVLPYCLGDECKPSYFHITYDPFGSSLMEPNPDYGSYYLFQKNHDHITSETREVVEKRPVEIVTMDHICRAEAASISPPDFLSLDTQGSEYQILQGAEETLRSNVLALITEVEFHPLYRGQQLFGDITSFLSDRGFDFVGFSSMHTPQSPFRAPVGLRAEGFQVSGEALYFRRLDNLPDDETESFIMLRKLAFISVVFNQFEYAIKCLERSNTLKVPDSVTSKLEKLSYYRFTRELEEQIALMPKDFPPTFTSKWTFEASQARFQIHQETRYGFKGLLRSIPILRAPRRYFHRARVKARRIAQRTASVAMLYLLARHSGVERIMIRHDLRRQAKILRDKRFLQSQFSGKAP